MKMTNEEAKRIAGDKNAWLRIIAGWKRGFADICDDEIDRESSFGANVMRAFNAPCMPVEGVEWEFVANLDGKRYVLASGLNREEAKKFYDEAIKIA